MYQTVSENMLHYIIIINRNSGILLFEKNVTNNLQNIKPDLLSGMLVGLRKISKEIKIGELTTFNTYNQKIFISVTRHTLIALIIDVIDSEKDFETLAFEIGSSFEQNYDIENWKGNTIIFNTFNVVLDKIIRKHTWKQVGNPKTVQEAQIIGYVIYDKPNRNYYNFMGKIYDPVPLITKSDLSEGNRIRIDEDDKIIFILKNRDTGCIIYFDRNIDDIKIERYLKTFTYSIQHIDWIASSFSSECQKIN